jgi:hypothetical protein
MMNKKQWKLRIQTVWIFSLNLLWSVGEVVDSCTWTKKKQDIAIEKTVAPRNLLSRMLNGTFLRFCIKAFGDNNNDALPLNSPNKFILIFLPKNSNK